jgi:tetratricopeptide (TPR) repeat protein
MGKKPSMILLFSALIAPSVLATPLDVEVREATQKNDWPEVILLLAPKKGQNIDHDFLLARAYLQMERRAEAQKWLSSLHSQRHDERSLRLWKAAGEIFFNQETSQLHSEGVRLISLLKFQEAQEKLEQALSREPGNTLVLVRLLQVALLLGRLDSAVNHLKELSAIAPDSLEIKIFALQLQNLGADSSLERAKLPIPAHLGKRPEMEVPWVIQMEHWKRQGRTEEIRGAAKEVLSRRPTWAYAQGWLLGSGLLSKSDEKRSRNFLEKNLKQKDRFEGELDREMRRTQYFWVGYVKFDELVSVLKGSEI